jgi:hypothetical protein
VFDVGTRLLVNIIKKMDIQLLKYVQILERVLVIII